MREFTDSTGRPWKLVVNGATIKRAAEQLGIDLGDPLSGSPSLLARIHTDLGFLLDLLWCVCRPQAEEADVSMVAFWDAIAGDTLHAAYEALLAEYADFFRSLRRPHVGTALDRHRETVTRALAIGEATLRSEKADALIERGLSELGGSCAALLERSESTPSTGPSENSTG